VNIFFDTSSLISLYHEEKETAKLLSFLASNRGYKVFLSEITIVEAYSAILKKVRIQHLSFNEAETFLKVLEGDFKQFSFIKLDASILHTSQSLLLKYVNDGLRSLDAIQLASAINIKSSIDKVLTGDIKLKQILAKEGFDCDL
jgi:uncharacterized protein